MTGWTAYLAAGAALIASHVVLSAPGVRAALREKLGRGPFIALHSTVSTLTLIAFIAGYLAADAGPQIFVPSLTARYTAILLMPFAVFGVVARLSTRAREGEALVAPRGIYLLSRAPGSLALVLWTALHLMNTGDARRLAAFAIMGAIALWAIVKNEIVLARSADPEAARWRAETALLTLRPAGGWARAWRGIGWARVGAALAFYVLLVLGHPYVLGPDPLLGALY